MSQPGIDGLARGSAHVLFYLNFVVVLNEKAGWFACRELGCSSRDLDKRKKNKKTKKPDCFAVVDNVLTCSLADKLLKFLGSFLGSTSPALYISSSISLIR